MSVQIPKHILDGGVIRDITLTKQDLIDFETEVADSYNDGEITALVSGDKINTRSTGRLPIGVPKTISDTCKLCHVLGLRSNGDC